MAFGNPDVYFERYIAQPRHIEIQILGDLHGNVVHLGERDCTVQRRHQKLIEESPSPVMTAPLREKMGQAAIAGAKAAGYTNAGTFEFLVDSDRQLLLYGSQYQNPGRASGDRGSYGNRSGSGAD